MNQTKLSSKGQVVIPRDVRDAHHWRTGTEFEVEDLPEGVLLRPRVPDRVSIEQVLGCTGYRGPARTVDEMKEAVLREAKKRGRY